MYQLPDGAVRVSSSQHAWAIGAYIITVAFGVHYVIADNTAISMYERFGAAATTIWAMVTAICGLACVYGAWTTPRTSDPLAHRRMELFGCIGIFLMFGFYEYSLISRNGFFEFPATEMLATGFALSGLARSVQIVWELYKVHQRRKLLAQVILEAGEEAEEATTDGQG